MLIRWNADGFAPWANLPGCVRRQSPGYLSVSRGRPDSTPVSFFDLHGLPVGDASLWPAHKEAREDGPAHRRPPGKRVYQLSKSTPARLASESPRVVEAVLPVRADSAAPL